MQELILLHKSRKFYFFSTFYKGAMHYFLLLIAAICHL